MGQAKTGEVKRARQRRRRGRAGTAARLGVQVRAVRDRGIEPGEVGGLLAARPSVREVWFQELKHAVSDADIDAIDARWAPEVRRAKREARQLAGELTPDQVRARIGREQDAAFEAARYRAGQLLRRALEG
jgi:hypothetical protein